MFVPNPQDKAHVLWQPKPVEVVAKFAKSAKSAKEPITGYQDHAPAGPRHCFSCTKFYAKQSACTGDKFKDNTNRPINAEGNIPVHAVGLCNYYQAKQ